ncbi:hypothetical protein [Paraburkholderia tropica]|uniref:hypothetical protein n=1 Tax=Paraburkholderia tropica TaxID=92647 RepID=UPI00160C89B6|nr:hypothetical protein [Paraburkholderia tropica]MBB2984460.1 hypothetical protein [Paraburkholderia tropica]
MATEFLKRYLERRRLEYAAEGMAIVKKHDSLDGLSVTHNGHGIERLTKSRIWLWNPSRTAIRSTDVIEENPLKVRFSGERIFSMSLIDCSDDVVGVRPRDLGDGIWQIDFDYWEAKQGVSLEALHTSSMFVPKITGSIKGFQPIRSLGPIDIGAFVSKRTRTFRRWVPALAVLFIAAGVAAIVEFHLAVDPRSVGALVLMAVGEFFAVLCASFWFSALSVPRAVRRLGVTSKRVEGSSAL